MSQNLYQLMQAADRIRGELGDEYIATEAVVLALFDQKYSPITKYLTDNGVTEKKLRQVVEKLRGGAKVTSKNAENNYQSLKKNMGLTWSNKPALAKWIRSLVAMTKFAM